MRISNYSQSMKVSSALRRIANARGRSRAEWRVAREANNAVFAAERDNLSRAPRLRKAARTERKEFRAIPVAVFLSATPELDAPHTVTLPTRDRIVADASEPGAADRVWAAFQQSIGR